MESFKMPEQIKSSAKVLPVILMLDVSGSMTGPPMETLNDSVKKMLTSFSKDESANVDIHVAIVTFGGDAELRIPLTKAGAVSWTDMVASGGTPLGSAITIVREMVENKDIIPSNAYRPTIMLVSDGIPTDNWRADFDRFLNAPRSSKCHRLALGINVTEGDTAYQMLEDFISPGEKVFRGDASKIVKFFKHVTMSVATRSKSVNPNQIPKIYDQ